MTDAQADDIPKMQPLGDRVLVKVEETADVTVGGVVLPDTAKERPLSGTIVTVGPGRYDKDAEGHRQPMKVGAGCCGSMRGNYVRWQRLCEGLMSPSSEGLYGTHSMLAAQWRQ